MSDSERFVELREKFRREPIANIPVPFAFELEFLEEGSAVVNMRVASGMLVGSVGIVNGGIMDTLANTASVYAAMSVIPSGHTPRMSFSSNNMRKAREGETLQARAAVLDENDNSIIVRFVVANKDLPSDVKAVGQAQYHKPKKS